MARSCGGPARRLRHWALVFGESVGISAFARGRFLAHARPSGVEMRRLSIDECLDVIGHVGDSAPGPCGLSYQAWLSAGSVVGHLLYSAYLDLCLGASPPDGFNSALLTLLPKATSLITTSCVAGPSRYRPLTLSNTVHELLAEKLTSAVEAYCI